MLKEESVQRLDGTISRASSASSTGVVVKASQESKLGINKFGVDAPMAATSASGTGLDFLAKWRKDR